MRMSRKALRILKDGRITSLLEAIYDEKSNLQGNTGKSKDGSLKVIRIG